MIPQTNDETQTQLMVAVEQIAYQATLHYPDVRMLARIDKAVKLIAADKVCLPWRFSPIATVESQQTPGRLYRVNGHCECPDASKAPGGLCKHRLAVGILKRAVQRLETRSSEKRPEEKRPMQITAMTVSVGKTVPHPDKGYTSLRADISLTANIDATADWEVCTQELQTLALQKLAQQLEALL
jgi:hypothetical protein